MVPAKTVWKKRTEMGYFSSIMRFLFVRQAALIDKYSEEAGREIARRNRSPHHTPETKREPKP